MIAFGEFLKLMLIKYSAINKERPILDNALRTAFPLLFKTLLLKFCNLDGLWIEKSSLIYDIVKVENSSKNSLYLLDRVSKLKFETERCLFV